jgi:uncharacterized protein (DUF736 family)
MATIGTFTRRSDGSFAGEIITLSVQSTDVRILPNNERPSDTAPSHRVVAGNAEIGAAWEKTSGDGRSYLGLKLDDPSFAAPIYANLYADAEGERYVLVWSRQKRFGG